MEKGKKNLFDWLLPVSDGANVNYKFEPSDNSLLKISWNSPNDNKANLFNVLFDTEPYTIRIKDNH